jgi:hypothetical protein
MSSLTSFLDSFPVATFIVIVGVIACAIVFVANGGHLSGDETAFFALINAAGAALGIGRGLITNRTPDQ